MEIEFRESDYRKDISSYVLLSEWEMDVKITTSDGPVVAFGDNYFSSWVWLFLNGCLYALPDIMAGIEVRMPPDLDEPWEMVFSPVGRQVGISVDLDDTRRSRVTIPRSEFAEGLLDGTAKFLEYIRDARPEWEATEEYSELEAKLLQNEQWYESILTRNEIP